MLKEITKVQPGAGKIAGDANDNDDNHTNQTKADLLLRDDDTQK